MRIREGTRAIHLPAVLAAVAVALLGACTGGDTAPEAADDALAARDSTPAPAVDHAAHLSADSAASRSAGTAADGAGHSTMAGHTPSATSAPVSASHAGHAGTAGTASAPAAGATAAGADDHAGHVAASPAPAPAGGLPSSRADLPVTPASTDSATARLLLLARELVRDSVVQRRISQDPALLEAWEQPEVREALTGPGR